MGSGGDSGQEGRVVREGRQTSGATEGPGIHKAAASAVSKSKALSAGDPALRGC